MKTRRMSFMSRVVSRKARKIESRMIPSTMLRRIVFSMKPLSEAKQYAGIRTKSVSARPKLMQSDSAISQPRGFFSPSGMAISAEYSRVLMPRTIISTSVTEPRTMRSPRRG